VVFEKTVTVAKALGIAKLGHLSTDGTKMKANASNDYTLSKAEIEAIREIIERGIAIDEEEELNKSGQSAVSITDPESRFMKNKKERIELSYNPQITVDHDSGIIVANGVTQDCTDHAQLELQVNSTLENVGNCPKVRK
jgi:hypothetical protein